MHVTELPVPVEQKVTHPNRKNANNAKEAIMNMGLLIDAKILAGGIAMLAVGITLTALFSAAMPVGQTGMTDEEALDLLLAQQEIHDYNTLSGILIAIGFLLVLISFGARARRRRGAAGRDRKTETRDEGGLSRT